MNCIKFVRKCIMGNCQSVGKITTPSFIVFRVPNFYFGRAWWTLVSREVRVRGVRLFVIRVLCV